MPTALPSPAARRVKPKALRPGDCVGVAAPAGPVHPAALARGVRWLESCGFRVRVAPHVYRQRGYLAGEDRERADDLNQLFADPEVAGILCARGGYGCMRLLPHLDWALIRSRPKFFAGFSDITALHLALGREADLVTFHGPILESPAGGPLPYNAQGLYRAMTETGPLGPLPAPPTDGGDACPLPPGVLVPGRAEGPLIGGNLTLLCALEGTPWAVHTEGCILLLEDVDERPYRIDRLLTQLLLSGKLQAAAGFVFGHSPTCEADPEGRRRSLTLREILEDLLVPLGKPLVYGLPLGHGVYRATVPLGVRARLVAGRRPRLVILEPALASFS